MKMKRSWMVVVLAAIIAGIGLIPVGVHAGSAYNRPCPEGRGYYVSPVTPYPSSGYVSGYAREEHRTTYRSPDEYDRAEVTYYAARPCGERTVKPCPTPKKVEIRCAHPCPSPCLNDIRRTSRELREVLKENERLRESVQIHQEHDRVNLIERQNLEKENATWRERVRNREAWIEDYRAKYIEHNGWR